MAKSEAEIIETVEIDEAELEAGAGSLEARALTRYRQHVIDNQERMRELVIAADTNQRFFSPLESQWSADLTKIFADLGISMKSLNQIWPAVQNVTGRETTQRYQAKITGRDPDDSGLAEAFNSAVRAIAEGDDYEQKISSAFRQAHVQRVGALELFVDVWSSKVPKFLCRRIPVDNLMIEFEGNEVNYSDRRGMAHGRWMNRWDFDERFPDDAKFWLGLVNDSGSGDFDTLDRWGIASSMGSENAFFFNTKTRTTFVVDFEWKERKEIFQLELPGETNLVWEELNAGEKMPISMEVGKKEMISLMDRLAESVVRAEQLLQQLMEARMAQEQAPEEGQQPIPDPQPPIFRNLISTEQLMHFKSAYLSHQQRPADMEGPGADGPEFAGPEDGDEPARDFTNYYPLQPETIYYASFVGNKVIRAGERRDQDWSIFPLIAFMDEIDGKQIPYGSVDVLWPRQEMTNMWLSVFLHQSAHQVRAQMGIDTEIATGADIETINRNATDGSKFLDIPGGGTKGALFPIPRADMSPIDRDSWRTFMDLVPAGLGQSMAGLGTMQELSRTATSLVNQQSASQTSTLAESFDSLRQMRRAITRKKIRMIIAYWSPDDLRRVAGQQAEFVPDDVSQWWKALEFDVVVGEEVSTKDQAQAAADALIDTGLWQEVAKVAPKVLPQVLHPIIGGSAFNEWMEGLAEQEPQRLLQSLGDALGLDPELIQQAIDQLQAGGEEVPA